MNTTSRINIKETYDHIVDKSREYFESNGLTKAVIGISGGIDSALTATIIADAIGGENVYLITMPSKYSSEDSRVFSNQFARKIGAHIENISIKKLHNEFDYALKGVNGVADENLQARIRGLILMTVANKMQHSCVVNTCNLSEDMTGYFTLYGDSTGAFSPLGDLYKTEVYAMSEYRNTVSDIIPSSIIDRVPTAELAEGQIDTDNLPDYDVLDDVLIRLANNESRNAITRDHGDGMVSYIEKLICRSAWKREQCPPAIKVNR